MPPWIEAALGQKPPLDRSRPWIEAALGQKPPLDRNRPWIEAVLGQKPPLDRSRPWIEAALGQKPPLDRSRPWIESTLGQKTHNSSKYDLNFLRILMFHSLFSQHSIFIMRKYWNILLTPLHLVQISTQTYMTSISKEVFSVIF